MSMPEDGARQGEGAGEGCALEAQATRAEAAVVPNAQD
jgi:hypothetical protein